MSERVNEEKKSPATQPARSPTARRAPAARRGAQARRQPVAAAKAEAVLPALGPMGMLRWAWTQLTSMRTALFLLLLLAVAAVPGSLFPQRPGQPVDRHAVHQGQPGLRQDPGLAPALRRVLLGVVLRDLHPAVHLADRLRRPARHRALQGHALPAPADARAAVPAARIRHPGDPRRRRDPGVGAIADAAGLLKKRGYRVDVRDRDGARPSVGAERGFLREVGNLVFHTSLIGVLVSVAIGGLFGYSGQRILVEGDTFVNTLVGYDQFTPGTNFQSSQLQPYSVQLDKFQITFDRESQGKFGQPIDFTGRRDHQGNPGRARQEGGAEGQRPPHPRRHQHVPHRQRLRPGGHHPRRRRQRRHAGPGGGQAAGRQLLLLRGHQGPGRQAGAARLRRLLPAHRVRHRRGRVLQRRSGAVQPAADPELVLRRPRPGRRRPAERLRTRRQEAHTAQRPQPRRRRHHPRARAPATPCPTARAPSASTA